MTHFLTRSSLVGPGRLSRTIKLNQPPFQKAMEVNDIPYEAHIYPGVNHGFHNDTTPRYDEAAAQLAEERMVAWFRTYLVG